MSAFKTTADGELFKLLSEKREALRTSRFGVAGSRARNVKEGRSLRREIAQILTELRTRTLANTPKNA